MSNKVRTTIIIACVLVMLIVSNIFIQIIAVGLGFTAGFAEFK